MVGTGQYRQEVPPFCVRVICKVIFCSKDISRTIFEGEAGPDGTANSAFSVVMMAEEASGALPSSSSMVGAAGEIPEVNSGADNDGKARSRGSDEAVRLQQATGDALVKEEGTDVGAGVRGLGLVQNTWCTIILSPYHDAEITLVDPQAQARGVVVLISRSRLLVSAT